MSPQLACWGTGYWVTGACQLMQEYNYHHPWRIDNGIYMHPPPPIEQRLLFFTLKNADNDSEEEDDDGDGGDTITKRTLTEEDDTVEDVSRDADAEDEGIEVADDDVLRGGESLKGDDVIWVVPRNEVVYVTIAFAVTMVHFNLHCRRNCIVSVTQRKCHHTAVFHVCFILFPESPVSERTCSQQCFC